MTLCAQRGRCPRCGNDPQGRAEFLAALEAQRPAGATSASASTAAVHMLQTQGYEWDGSEWNAPALKPAA